MQRLRIITMQKNKTEAESHNQPIRPAKQFNSPDIKLQQQSKLSASTHFDANSPFIPTEVIPTETMPTGISSNESGLSSPHSAEQTLDQFEQNSDESLKDDLDSQTSLFNSSRLSGAKKILLGGITLFTTAGIAQLIANVMNHWQSNSWLSLLFDASLLTLASGGVFAILNEIRKLKRLRYQLARQVQAQTLIDENQHNGAGKGFCLDLAEKSGLTASKHQEANPSFQYFLSIVDDTHSDAEILTLYHRYVLKQQDQKALKLIEQNMLESGLLVAVSPLAIVDMLFVAWRNIRLVNKIAEIYGIEISYWARIRLFRQVLINIAFVGGAELLSELGSDVLSQDLLSRFSTRAAQGIGAGFLTARLGLQTMKLCRPIPFIDDRPRLKDLRQQLISNLSKLVKKS